MNAAVIVIGLCALGANAQFISSVLPYSAYTPNFLHSAAFTPAVAGPITYAAAAPVAYTTAAVAPTTITTQHHAQDELGQVNFGYAGGPSSRHEVRDAFGNVRGAFNYIDANGKVQHQSYVADALGFRVAATNLPVAPEVPSGADTIYLNPPKPVEDTPEVATAKAAHKKAFDEAAAAAAAAPDAPTRKKRSVGSVAIHSAVSPLNFAYGFNTVHPYSGYTAGHAVAPALTYAATAPAVTYAAAAPAVTYAAATPAVAAPRDATLLRVENNPGHAVSYRVY